MFFNPSKRLRHFTEISRKKPQAMASIKGSDAYASIKGSVFFWQTEYGVIVTADISGLPKSPDKCKSPVFAFHIHSGNYCTGDMTDPFAKAMSHYNPNKCPHPYHAGDMPPLFGNNGYAYESFLTNRFTVDEIIGLTVIIHDNPDDFTTQPSGNSGKKIACGKIHR